MKYKTRFELQIEFNEHRPPRAEELRDLTGVDCFDVLAAWINWKIDLKFEQLMQNQKEETK